MPRELYLRDHSSPQENFQGSCNFLTQQVLSHLKFFLVNSDFSTVKVGQMFWVWTHLENKKQTPLFSALCIWKSPLEYDLSTCYPLLLELSTSSEAQILEEWFQKGHWNTTIALIDWRDSQVKEELYH